MAGALHLLVYHRPPDSEEATEVGLATAVVNKDGLRFCSRTKRICQRRGCRPPRCTVIGWVRSAKL